MSLDLLVELALKGALCAAATLVAIRMLGNRSAAERSLIAHLGLAATLVVPGLSLLLPAWRIPGTTGVIEATAAPLWLYLPPALLLGGVTLIAVYRLFGLRRRAAVLVEPAWLGALAHAQRRMGFKSGAALLASDDIASPVSWGLFRPTIVLDDRALAAHDEAEAIIAHELAHVARADWAKLLLARVATAAHWFNPLVWLLARECHELREEAADDAVLNHDVDGTGYAAILVGSARHECRGMLLAAHGVAPAKGSLRRRIMRVLDTTRRRAPAGTGFAALTFALGLALGAPLAAVTTRPAPPVAPSAPTAPSVPALVASPHAMSAAPAAPVAPLPVADRDAPIANAARPAPIDGTAARYTADELIAMRNQGISAEWLRGMAAAGYRDLSADDAIAMAQQGISTDYARGMTAAGRGQIDPEDLIAMRVQGVDADYARRMAAAGYARATTDQLIAMRIQGVTPDYARAMSRAGGPRLSPDQLIALRTQGVDHEFARAIASARASATVEARTAARQARREALESLRVNGFSVPRPPAGPVPAGTRRPPRTTPPVPPVPPDTDQD